MDLDDIEIQTVEVVRTPDGSRICRIYYVKKPLAQQDPAKRAKVQFVDNTPSRNPVQASFQEPIATPLQSMAQALVRTRKAWEARPSKPRKPLLATIWNAWRNASAGVKALTAGACAAILLQMLFLIIRLGSD